MSEAWQKHEKQLQVSLLLAPNLKPIRQAVTDVLRLCERLSDTWPSVLRSDQPEAVTGMATDFSKSLSFVSAGLRSVSRAGGEAGLQALAERLQWEAG